MRRAVKYIMLICCVLLLTVAAVGCRKDINCRCAVRGASGSPHPLDVRVITVSSRSDCRDIYYVVYNTGDLSGDQGMVDSLFCTDYPFDVTVVDSTVTHSNGAKQ